MREGVMNENRSCCKFCINARPEGLCNEVSGSDGQVTIITEDFYCDNFKDKRNAGFTLVEVLVLITLLSVIALVGFLIYAGIHFIIKCW